MVVRNDGRCVGRTEIIDHLNTLYRITSWRTVRRWKKYYVFPIRYTHTGIPYIISDEVLMWAVEYEKAVAHVENPRNDKFLNVRRLSP